MRKAPQKECPLCKLQVHVKKSSCQCGFQFYEKKVASDKNVSKIGRSTSNAPQKLCPKCNNKCHTKSSKCQCGHSFYNAKFKPEEIKSKPEVGEKVNNSWKSLVPGDIIKSVNGYGPYWENPNNGEKTYMGSYGRFRVKEIASNGIMAISHSKDSHNQFEFIYMGEHTQSKLSENMYRSPHKLFKLKGKKNED